MKKAIVTRYFGPGAVRGSRIQAKAEGVGTLWYDFDHADSHEGRHCLAAKTLAEKFGWNGTYIAGGLPDGKDTCFVQIDMNYTSIDTHAMFEILGRENVDWFCVEGKR